MLKYPLIMPNSSAVLTHMLFSIGNGLDVIKGEFYRYGNDHTNPEQLSQSYDYPVDFDKQKAAYMLNEYTKQIDGYVRESASIHKYYNKEFDEEAVKAKLIEEETKLREALQPTSLEELKDLNYHKLKLEEYQQWYQKRSAYMYNKPDDYYVALLYLTDDFVPGFKLRRRRKEPLISIYELHRRAWLDWYNKLLTENKKFVYGGMTAEQSLLIAKADVGLLRKQLNATIRDTE